MPKRNLIVILGVLVALAPFIGFPRVVEDTFITIGGLCIVLLAFDYKKFRKSVKKGRRSRKGGGDEGYVDNVPTRSGNFADIVPPKTE